MEPTLTIDASLAPCPTLPALIWAEGIAPPQPETTLPAFLAAVVARAQEQGESFWTDGVRQRVRHMLRYGHYRPSGRAKPASEFLLRAALEDTFPAISGPVDVNNAISLESGFPASIFDQELTGDQLLLRRGHEEESYLFNSAGQRIDLRDLLVVCRYRDGRWEPCGNPVKDSMATKTRESTRRVVAVLYAPADEPRESVERWADHFATLLREHCRAQEVGYRVLGEHHDQP